MLEHWIYQGVVEAFFLLSSLEATSDYLSELLQPQVDAYEVALELDPLAELDDFMSARSLPTSIQAKLDERQEWVRRVFRDGEKLTKWNEARNKADRDEKKRIARMLEQHDSEQHREEAAK
ncbi:uncharacterized protein JCM15063_005512 [Sporobolomyces koalae]|uniref:uncharacterized protein n=1 Tax=Sporobolomyces koalae TaxID=500713 RepID=UPI00316E825D